MSIVTAIILAGLILLFVSFRVGVLCERHSWNQSIRNGSRVYVRQHRPF